MLLLSLAVRENRGAKSEETEITEVSKHKSLSNLVEFDSPPSHNDNVSHKFIELLIYLFIAGAVRENSAIEAREDADNGSPHTVR